jgi:putative membrane protein insertion efficiency factor
MMRMALLLLILPIVSTATAYGQSEPMWDFSKKQTKVNQSRTFLSAQIFLVGQIRLYQLLLSEQQPDACNFSPSCSHFAYRAIMKKGSLEGTLMAIDRLQRCNPWAWNYHGTHYGVTWVPGRGYKLTDPP